MRHYMVEYTRHGQHTCVVCMANTPNAAWESVIVMELAIDPHGAANVIPDLHQARIGDLVKMGFVNSRITLQDQEAYAAALN